MENKNTSTCSCSFYERKTVCLATQCSTIINWSINTILCAKCKSDKNEQLARHKCWTYDCPRILYNDQRECYACWTQQLIPKTLENINTSLQQMNNTLGKLEKYMSLEERVQEMQDAIEFTPLGDKFKEGEERWNSRPT